jgi:hypothetical protein
VKVIIAGRGREEAKTYPLDGKEDRDIYYRGVGRAWPHNPSVNAVEA